jgi:hypothetical protein
VQADVEAQLRSRTDKLQEQLDAERQRGAGFEAVTRQLRRQIDNLRLELEEYKGWGKGLFVLAFRSAHGRRSGTRACGAPHDGLVAGSQARRAGTPTGIISSSSGGSCVAQ